MLHAQLITVHSRHRRHINHRPLRYSSDLKSMSARLADKSLKEACSELQLSLDQVLEKLQECGDRENGAGPAIPPTLSCCTSDSAHRSCPSPTGAAGSAKPGQIGPQTHGQLAINRRVQVDRRACRTTPSGYVGAYSKRGGSALSIHCSHGRRIHTRLSAGACLLPVGQPSCPDDGTGA